MCFKLKGRKLQYLSPIFGSTIIISTFMSLNWSAPAAIILSSENTPLDRPITQKEWTGLFFLLMAGSVLGNIFLAIFLNIFGRRGTLLVTVVPILVSWLMIYFGTTVTTILISRFIMGFGLSYPVHVMSIYVSEISETEIRGKISYIILTSALIGIITTLAVGPYYYYALSLIGICLTIIGFVLFYFMPESPIYYLTKNNLTAAEKSLLRLRDSEDVKEELEALRNAVEETMWTRGTVKDIFTKESYRKAFFIGVGLKTMQEVSGGHFLEANITEIFALADTGLDENIQSLIITVAIIPFLFFGGYFVDKFGRKLMLYIGTLGFTLSMALEAIYFFLKSADKVTDAMAFMPITGLFMAQIFRATGINSVSILMMGELYPVNIKGVANAMIQLYGSVFGTMLSLLFSYLTIQVGLSACFVLFAVACLGGFVFSLFFVPETQGKTLDEIQKEFEK